MPDQLPNISALRAALLAGTSVHDAVCNADAGRPAVLVPADMRVEDLEKLLPSPIRVRRNYKTSRLDDFLIYCTKQLPRHHHAYCVDGHPELFPGLPDRDPHIFYSTDPAGAFAILDFGREGAPAWCDHTANWTPEESPALLALRALLGKALDQDTLTNYIDDWADILSFETADGTLVNPAAARGAIADLSAEAIKSLRNKTGDFSRERTAVERVSMAPTVPTRMGLHCAPWVGFSPSTLRVRIAAADSTSLALRLTLIGWPAVLDTLVTELRERLEAIEAPITVLSGQASWPI